VYISFIIKNKQIMPYISKEQVKVKREALKKALPQFKMSITTDNYSGIKVAIMKGPVDFGIEYAQLNEYADYREPRWDRDTEQYVSNPAIADLMETVMPILNDGMREGHDDSDYGHIPDYYTWVHIGQWDKAYEVVNA
jgi:hypothetical protein